jgi:hypothetical protein
MGNYYLACGMTQVPIIDGSRVVMFLMTEANAYKGWGDRYSLGMDSPDTFWSPRHLPLRGSYAGYGEFALDEVPSWQRSYIEAEIRRSILPYEEPDKIRKKDGQIHKEPGQVRDSSGLTIEDLLLWIQRDEAFTKNFKGIQQRVGLMAVHEKAYDAFQNTHLKVDYRDFDKEAFRRNLREVETRLITGYDKQILIDHDAYRDWVYELLTRTRQGDINGNTFCDHNLGRTANLIADYIAQGRSPDDAEWAELREMLVDYAQFSYAMLYLRKPFLPQMMSGDFLGHNLIRKLGTISREIMVDQNRRNSKPNVDLPPEPTR